MSRQKKSECIAQQGILSVNVHIADPTGITVLTATELGPVCLICKVKMRQVPGQVAQSR